MNFSDMIYTQINTLFHAFICAYWKTYLGISGNLLRPIFKLCKYVKIYVDLFDYYTGIYIDLGRPISKACLGLLGNISQ